MENLAKISIRGPIISNDDQWIYDWLEWEATSPKSVQKQMDSANGEDLEVEINSDGGSVFDGSEIYTDLKSYQGHVTTKIVGMAASAASVIAMAGKKVVMAPTAQMMIHNASVRASGDYRDMDHMSGVLKNTNQTIANAYRIKSGKSDEELLKMMDAETWLTPQQALDHGLIDEVLFEDNIQIVASFSNGLLPQKIIEKIKNEMLSNPTNPFKGKPDIFMQKRATAQLNLLKLKGGFINE